MLLILAGGPVFVAGLMVGRTPEYLGKKIRAREVKFAALYILTTPAVVLVGTGLAMWIPSARASCVLEAAAAAAAAAAPTSRARCRPGRQGVVRM